jgi:hypothetical protein
MRSTRAVGCFLLLLVASPCLARQCVGDCNGDGAVTINELVTIVAIDLGIAPTSTCPASQCDCGLPLAIFPGICCAIRSVSNALNGCASATPTGPSPTSPLPPTPTATPTTIGTLPIGGFSIDGCVNEFPGGGSGCEPGTTVRLDPLGITATTYADPYFHFSNIPPGDYTLSVVQKCNPFGCWEPIQVMITDHDVFQSFPLNPFPTQTPRPSGGTTLPSMHVR